MKIKLLILSFLPILAISRVNSQDLCPDISPDESPLFQCGQAYLCSNRERCLAQELYNAICGRDIATIDKIFMNNQISPDIKFIESCDSEGFCTYMTPKEEFLRNCFSIKVALNLLEKGFVTSEELMLVPQFRVIVGLIKAKKNPPKEEI